MFFLENIWPFFRFLFMRLMDYTVVVEFVKENKNLFIVLN